MKNFFKNGRFSIDAPFGTREQFILWCLVYAVSFGLILPLLISSQSDLLVLSGLGLLFFLAFRVIKLGRERFIQMEETQGLDREKESSNE